MVLCHWIGILSLCITHLFKMISIIVPVYNVEHYLSSTIESLIHQVGDINFEIILIDDGSTDSSGEICDKYASENDNITVVHKLNGGLSSARNAGIEAARGEYLMFVDGDDCLDPSTISTLTRAVSLHPNCDVIQYRYEEVPPSMQLGHCVPEELTDYYECTNEHDYFEQLYQLGGVAASACTKLIKRSVVGDLRFKEGVVHEDEEFVTGLLPKCSCIGYCSNEFYKYLMRPGSIIHSNFSSKRLNIIQILKDRITYLEGRSYVDLVEKYRYKLYDILLLLWDSAYKSHDVDSVVILEEELNELSCIRPRKCQDIIILKSGVLRSSILRTLFHFRTLLRPVVQKVRNARIKYIRYKECKRRRKQLKYKDFTIISNNCWGGLVYQYFGLRYSSPTVGLFMMDDDYIKFLENIDYYLSQSLVFITHSESKYRESLQRETTAKDSYPVALLGDVEVHFMHYLSQEEAIQKWEYRKSRINKERLLIKMSQRSSNDPKLLERFENLPYANKICFTEVDYPGKSFIQVPELKRLNIQGGDETPFVMDKVDLVSLINGLF